jgi:hypothetical protein
LNDDVKGRSLAAALPQGRARTALQDPDPKREKRLLRNAAAAYLKLDALKPLRV